MIVVMIIIMIKITFRPPNDRKMLVNATAAETVVAVVCRILLMR